MQFRRRSQSKSKEWGKADSHESVQSLIQWMRRSGQNLELLRTVNHGQNSEGRHRLG